MRASTALLLVFFSCHPIRAQKEPKYLPPLAIGEAPECPQHVGVRNYKSEIAKTTTGTTVYITGVAARDDSSCRRSAELHVERASVNHSYPLPGANQQGFFIAGFSPDASRLLLFAERYEESPDEYFRYLQIAVVPIGSGEMHWRNVWDIFQWHDCDATVEPQGLVDDSTVVFRARPSIMHGHNRPNCVSDVGLYSVNLEEESISRLTSDAEVKRHGDSVGGPCQTCKTDPDIVGACFTVHGRLAMSNGTPTYRLWRIGTDRMLGVHDFIVPASIATNLTWENAAFGHFYVCPFTRQKSEEMQIVCVESASEVIYKKW